MFNDESKPLLEHLEELRKRLLSIFATAAVGFLISYPFVDRIIHYFAKYTGGFVFLHPTEAFFVRLKISFTIGLFLAVPVIIYHVYRFIGVGLNARERRSTLALIPISYALFCMGAALAWFGVMPFALKFLLGYTTADLRPLISIGEFVGFATWMAIGFGAMFQLPLVVYLLAKFGVIGAKTLVYHRPTVIVGLAILSAFLTPGPDVFSQLTLLIPSIILFEISIFIVKRVEKKRNRQPLTLPSPPRGEGT